MHLSKLDVKYTHTQTEFRYGSRISERGGGGGGVWLSIKTEFYFLDDIAGRSLHQLSISKDTIPMRS